MEIMKAKSIATIREILIQNEKDASCQYKTHKYNLKQKYNVEWLGAAVMTNQEKTELNNDKNSLKEARELLEDFENHEW